MSQNLGSGHSVTSQTSDEDVEDDRSRPTFNARRRRRYSAREFQRRCTSLASSSDLVSKKRSFEWGGRKLRSKREHQMTQDGNILMLVEEQKREKEEALKQIHLLERKLEAKNEELNEMMDAIDDLESLNRALIIKQRQSNDELQEARKELIDGLFDILQKNKTNVGIKRMGEIDGRAFVKACKGYSVCEVMIKAIDGWSLWQENLKDPAWHPFRIIEADGKTEELINEDDEKLKQLREEWGDDVYRAVTVALQELNEYNRSGRYVINELWNYKEGRRATVKEVVKYIFKTYERKR